MKKDRGLVYFWGDYAILRTTHARSASRTMRIARSMSSGPPPPPFWMPSIAGWGPTSSGGRCWTPTCGAGGSGSGSCWPGPPPSLGFRLPVGATRLIACGDGGG